jgi:hypothetical protein
MKRSGNQTTVNRKRRCSEVGYDDLNSARRFGGAAI